MEMPLDESEINSTDEFSETDHADDTTKLQESFKLKATFFNGFKAILRRLLTWSQTDVLDESDASFVVEYLETLFDISLIPYYIFKFFDNHPHIVRIMKIIGKVILETIMWHFFAGVSTLISIILIIEDHYYLNYNYHGLDETINYGGRSNEENSESLNEN